jgi:hypothetical protein
VNHAVLTRTDVANVVNDDDTTSVTSEQVRFTGEDGASVVRFGQRTQTADILLAQEVDAQALGDYLATRRSVPTPWLSTVSTSLTGATSTAMTSAAQLELGDRVLVERTTPDGRSLSWRVTAEGIDHSISTNGWLLSLSTAPTDLASLYGSADWFALNVSVLDGSDVLAAY